MNSQNNYLPPIWDPNIKRNFFYSTYSTIISSAYSTINARSRCWKISFENLELVPNGIWSQKYTTNKIIKFLGKENEADMWNYR